MNLSETLAQLNALQDEYQHTMYLAEHAQTDTERIQHMGDAQVKLLKIKQMQEWLRTNQTK